MEYLKSLVLALADSPLWVRIALIAWGILGPLFIRLRVVVRGNRGPGARNGVRVPLGRNIRLDPAGPFRNRRLCGPVPASVAPCGTRDARVRMNHERRGIDADVGAGVLTPVRL